MTEITGKYEIEDSTENAMEMIGTSQEPSLEIEAPRTVTERRGGKLVEADRPAFVKIYTSFKTELKDIDPDALKVWLFIALSVNRRTGEAHPGLRAISDGVGLAVNTVRAAVERLDTKYSLLQIGREDGKPNKYYPADYVSANRETVSRDDTVPPTVSKTVGTVSKNEPTVSNQYRKSAQPEEPDLTREKEKSLDFKNMTIPQARRVSTLKMYYDATGWLPADILWEKVHNLILENGLTAEKLSAAAEAWVGQGYKRGNVMGILDWAIHGIPQGKTSAAQQAAQTQPVDKFAALMDYVDRQETGS